MTHKVIILVIRSLGILALVLSISSCESKVSDPKIPDDSDQMDGFPPFITPIEEYFVLNISGNHHIDGNSYRLKVSGAVDNPAEFSLEELRKLEVLEKTLTVECIENGPKGSLLGTATWKGFNVYALLQNLGIKEEAKFVKYICSDGYFTYNTLEELKNSDVLGALYMNDEPLPEKFGFPLRILFPGYYGVRQPGWVVEIELLNSGIRDFWGETQYEKWNTDSAMAIDSKIFFPVKNDTLILGENLRIGGTAYGSKRISSVEFTVDGGISWIPATTKKSVNEDYVWIFWEANYNPQTAGNLTIHARATGHDGRVQPKTDNNYLDGNNAWPSVTIVVRGGG